MLMVAHRYVWRYYTTFMKWQPLHPNNKAHPYIAILGHVSWLGHWRPLPQTFVILQQLLRARCVRQSGTCAQHFLVQLLELGLGQICWSE